MVKKVKITYKGESKMVPETYMKGLKGEDRKKQIKSIFEGKDRPKTKAPNKRSSWAEKFEKKYKTKISDKEFIHKNIITKAGQKKIIDKGKGAYYSSGSRPNQTPTSWGLGRLASVILGGPARKIDKDIWLKYKLK
tara:strand:+ start:1305 stop:1712 length:408 start_codon:yes stop_codon:yes gene_type:complete